MYFTLSLLLISLLLLSTLEHKIVAPSLSSPFPTCHPHPLQLFYHVPSLLISSKVFFRLVRLVSHAVLFSLFQLEFYNTY